MCTSVASLGPLEKWAPPAAKPLDEAVWQAWVAKGRAQDRRGRATRIRAVKLASIAGLLGMAGLWSHVAPFGVAVRVLLSAGAMVVMFQAFRARYYAVAAMFGALALLYNPVVPVFGFSGGWQGAVVAASAVPFIASIAWRNAKYERTERND